MTDREKQIEEMAKVMCGGCPNNKECMHCLCQDWYNAEALYNAGYRCCDNYPDHDNYMADDYENKPNLEYCPNCGCKMHESATDTNVGSRKE